MIVEATGEILVSIEAQYLASLYWSITTWTTVGYGDYMAKTNLEKIYACVAQLFGGLMFGILVSKMAGMVDKGSLSDEKLKARTEEISEFMRVKAVPLQLRRKIRMFFESIYAKNSVFDNQEFLVQLAPGLRKEMVDYLYMNVIGEMVLITGVEKSTIQNICISLKNCVYERGTKVMIEDDDSSDLFVVLSGEIKITRQAVHTGALSAGSFFGEDAVCEYYCSGRDESCRTRRTESGESVYFSTLAYLNRSKCADLMDTSWRFRINVLQAFTRRHARAERRVQNIKSLRWRAVATRVEVTVIKAEEIPIMDCDGSTDPYIVIAIKDGSKEEQYRTVTKENAGSNPAWGRVVPQDQMILGRGETTGQTLTFPSTMGRTIEVEAWDDDGIMSADDSIGAGRVEVPPPATDQYEAQKEEPTVVWVKLNRKFDKSGYVFGGRVLLSIKCWRLEGNAGTKKSMFTLARSIKRANIAEEKYVSSKALISAAKAGSVTDNDNHPAAAAEASSIDGVGSGAGAGSNIAMTTNEKYGAEMEAAACKIQGIWRWKMARKSLAVSRYEEKLWTKRGMNEGGKTQSTMKARTDRQKTLNMKSKLNRTLYEKVKKVSTAGIGVALELAATESMDTQHN